MALKVPSEREVLADVPAVVEWVAAWREAEAAWPVTVTWGERRWSSVGRQAVPERARLDGAAAIASVAGRAEPFAALAARCAALREALEGADPDALTAALGRHGSAIAAMGDADFALLAGVVRWLAEHPGSGRYVRELPLRGVHGKWVEERRALVTALVATVTGSTDLGLAVPPRQVRLRSLDPAWSVGGLRDVSLRLDEAAALDVAPPTVLIVENLQTLLALPSLPGVVALYGGGYAVDAWGEVPWLDHKRVLYWGDLDSHGFAIVHRARSHGLRLETVLMDVATLEAHRDLWVPEPAPTHADLASLTADEGAALAALRAAGDVRLEQERIPWDDALAALERGLVARGHE